MCRLLGIAASEPTSFRILHDAKRSLAALSLEHRDGWGIAVFDSENELWHVEKGAECAGEDARFHASASVRRGALLVSHVRRKTVGVTSLANTHPFQSGRWVFAHNGTVVDLAWLRAGTSARRRDEVRGETDSELLFAWLLTRLDEADGEVDRVLCAAVERARARPGFGAFNFLLSDGSTTYAHRFGRTMFLLERGPREPHRGMREKLTSADGTTVLTPWSQRRHAIFVASERMTDEPWQEVPEGALLRIDRTPLPRWRFVVT